MPPKKSKSNKATYVEEENTEELDIMYNEDIPDFQLNEDDEGDDILDKSEDEESDIVEFLSDESADKPIEEGQEPDSIKYYTEQDDGAETEKCLYRHATNLVGSSDDDISDEIFDDDDNLYKKKGNISKPFLTKYEKVRLMCDRVSQLYNGAPPMIKHAEHLTPEQIVKLELKHKVIPMIIERPISNRENEIWKITDLATVSDSEYDDDDHSIEGFGSDSDP